MPFDANMMFGKSRWRLTLEEGEKLCTEGLSTTYEIPSWAGRTKRTIEGKLNILTDLAALKFEIRALQKEHVMGASLDQGHQKIHRSLNDLILFIEKTEDLLKKPNETQVFVEY